jgi:hypothetical protein
LPRAFGAPAVGSFYRHALKSAEPLERRRLPPLARIVQQKQAHKKGRSMAATSTVTVLRPKLRTARPFAAQPPHLSHPGPHPVPHAGPVARERHLPTLLLAPLLLASGMVAGMLVTALWLRELGVIAMTVGLVAAFVAGALFWRRAAGLLDPK